MSKKVVPMIHVPDVRATASWYQDIGFTVEIIRDINKFWITFAQFVKQS